MNKFFDLDAGEVTSSFFSSPSVIHLPLFTECLLPGGSDGKASAYNAGDPGLIPGSGRSPGEGNGNPAQQSCLENPMDGGIWLATVHGVTKSRTQLSDFTHSLTKLKIGTYGVVKANKLW